MRHLLWLIALATVPSLLWMCTAKTAADGPKASSLPPLKVDKSAPLLLLDEPAKPASAASADGPVADNSACYCCHDNYQTEEMVTVHAREDIGCVECHGQSYDHRNDEDNVTPPDIMIPADQIAASCQKCHETHDAPARDVIARWQERCPAKQNPDELLCTDCHGAHRLALRTVRWDKKTRKLLGRPEE
ncbi:MAG: hypothetical protein HUU20_03870 [Pirellulales bacterium]|nr:hypothetical protein [Pirellulales bacterium]